MVLPTQSDLIGSMPERAAILKTNPNSINSNLQTLGDFYSKEEEQSVLKTNMHK